MAAQLTFFPVGCGDTALLQLADDDRTGVLIDVHIRSQADDPDDDMFDVASDLRSRLPRDGAGRPYVDAFLLSHPDKDHCLGLARHFHLGPISDYADDEKLDAEKKIVIREIWSSPIVFRRASRKHTLCDDALAFQAEAKRRVRRFRDGKAGVDGERVLILGEDVDGKTDGLDPILVRAGASFDRVNGKSSQVLSARLLGPMLACSDEQEEELSKNDSSTIINFHIASSPQWPDVCRFLTGGDAEVAVWERIWAEYKNEPDALEYDVLLAPHHCSWHSLSYDSWSMLGKKAKVSADARSALGQARQGAIIVASSKPVCDDDADPPCIRAKREYEAICEPQDGLFLCTGEDPTEKDPRPIELEVMHSGARRKKALAIGAAGLTTAQAPRAG